MLRHHYLKFKEDERFYPQQVVRGSKFISVGNFTAQQLCNFLRNILTDI